MAKPDALVETMQRLYRSEINCSISSFWDCGWTVRIGDWMNGFDAEGTFFGEELPKAAEWLRQTAIELYPDSDFAREQAKSDSNPATVNAGSG